ncbi:hypothetical protein [Uliginosibacterium gangwonense]|uniref:hypothetical protein n=1 Tax=Uliginosibacterium gangwonense TaxID=392736 RepID=UPI000362400C|nr:hypothetical protein [Uliginosibacterium gangwonense]
MSYPAFFEDIPHIRVFDALSKFLGASDNGILEYGYSDAVRLAGHSCPTVASAYWLTVRALTRLYPGSEELPERGRIAVTFRESIGTGTTGVVASVATLITGAAGEGGFKGLQGRFVRRGLLEFANATQTLELCFTRLDTGASVSAQAYPQRVPASSDLPRLMQICMQGIASDAEQAAFATQWQARVRSLLLEYAYDDDVFEITSA